MPGVNSHCINTVFGTRLAAGAPELHMDAQNSKFRWFGTDAADLHPYIQRKIRLLRGAVCAEPAAAAAARPL